MKLITRRRKRNLPVEGNGSYDAAAVVAAIAEGRWRSLERFNFTRDVVEVLARDPKRRAVTFLGKDGVIQPLSFQKLSEGAARWATLLRENGVEPGARVLVLTGTTVDWLQVMLAVMKVGAVSVPCPERMSAAALGIRISSSGAKAVVACDVARDELSRIADAPPLLFVEDFASRASSLPTEAPTHDTSPRDPAFVLTTSGTATGPRGVTHTHAAAFAARLPAEHWLDAGPHDAVWCTADASTGVAVFNTLLGPWSRGAEIVLHHGPFDPAERLTLVRRLDTTVLCQTPHEYEALLAAGDISRYRPPRLRRLVSTGDHLSPEVVAAFEEAWDLTICDGYGQVETGIVVANGAGPGYREGSIGLPLPGCDVVVVDEQGNEVQAGTAGELALRGRPPTLFSGYWEAPDETKAAFRGDTYLTGDYAAADEDGFLWFLGRSGDVIFSAGRRFGPIEVEDALAQHAGVAEAAVVGVRDLERGGQYVRAFVVLTRGVEGSDRLAAELREHARHSLVDHKVPREIEFVDELPRTFDGKLRRLDLRERPVTGFGGHWAPAAAPALAPERREPPAEMAAELVEPPPVFEAEAPVETSTAETDTAEPVQSEAVVETEVEPLSEVFVEPVPDPEFDARVETVSPVDEQVARPAGEPLEAAAGWIEVAEPEAEPEPTPAAFVEPAFEPLPPPPEPAREPELVLEPEPAFERQPEPEPVTGPVEVAREVEPEAGPVFEVEPEPVLEAAPEPVLEAAPEPVVEPEPVFEAVAAPEPTPEPEPEPEPEPAPEPEPVPEPVAEVIPLDAPSASPAPEPQPDDLPDFIVVPGVDRPDPSSDGASTLGFRPITELIFEPPDETEPRTEAPKPRRERPEADRRSGKDRRKRSSHEPGDDSVGTDWMQGLSGRLSAYSLSEEREASADADDDTSEDEAS